MAIAPVLDRPVEEVEPSKHWLRTHVRGILLAIAWVISLAVVFEYGHWLQSGMGFTDHMGHMVNHFAAFFSTGDWNGYDVVAKYMWRLG
jgi:hypothetical protein